MEIAPVDVGIASVDVEIAVIFVPAGIPGPLIGVPIVREPHSILATVSVVPVTEALNVAQGGTAFTVAPLSVVELAARPIARPG